MLTKVHYVPHVWITSPQPDGSFHGRCLRCKWEISGEDSDAYKRAQDTQNVGEQRCSYQTRAYHELYFRDSRDTRTDIKFVCHHCGVTLREDEDEKKLPPCTYPSPDIEGSYDMLDRHTWSYHEKPTYCVCTCEECGLTVVAENRGDSFLVTAKEDKNIPCVSCLEKRDDQGIHGVWQKTIKCKKDPAYWKRCQEVLEDLVGMRQILEDDSQSLAVLALHEKSFEMLMQRARDLVAEYKDGS